MSEHSVLSASAASRWASCPISVLGTEGSKSNEAAAEGTAMHTLAEVVLRGGAWPALGTKLAAVEGFEFELTEERLNSVRLYTDYVQSLPWMAPYSVEGRMHYGRALDTPHNLTFGTADVFGFTEDAGGVALRIIDAKFGRKAVVSAENLQGALYANGVLETLLPLRLPRSHAVVIVIMQPRTSSRPQEWHTTVGWLEDKAQEMRPAAQAAIRFHAGTQTAADLTSFPELPGKHCTYCKRRADCKSFTDKVKSLATPGKAVEWNPTVFAMTDAIKGYLDDLNAMVLDEAAQGRRLPGSKVVRGKRGAAVLRVPDTVIRERAIGLGIESLVVRQQEVWSTPAKIRDAFKKAGVPEEERNGYFDSPEGKLVATLESDPREEAIVESGNVFDAVAR